MASQFFIDVLPAHRDVSTGPSRHVPPIEYCSVECPIMTYFPDTRCSAPLLQLGYGTPPTPENKQAAQVSYLGSLKEGERPKEKVIILSDVPPGPRAEALKLWVAEWETHAEAKVKSNLTAGKAKKVKLSHTIKELDNGDLQVKFKVPPQVLADAECTAGVAPFDLTRGLYNIAFSVVGIWYTETSYGLTIHAKKLVRTGDAPSATTGTVAPCEISFASVPDEFK